ncbi:SDR family NAD(P)-dependent oxidoreductase [Patulibacter minatonensis]|uniref:SDR family NAD(P)-dependent oxidoreductase n=1 Tax=Patulibacter minatonensis TaxID=298163 RepID=UPI000479245A|nr:glucose 1-dehydrogenase [Patulibacter minatonensis]
MTGLLDGKVAIVTGAGGGIGRVTVRALLEDGARVVVSELSEETGRATLDELGAGGDAIFVQNDVTDLASNERAVAAAVEAFGRLDVAFNNAGIDDGGLDVADMPVERFERVIAVNLIGVFLSMKAQLPQMLAQGGGSIINCASVAGLMSLTQQSAYITSKHGVIGLTKAAANDYSSRGIRVNAVCPGVINTPMVEEAGRLHPGFIESLTPKHLIGRIGESREIADAVVWLGSDRSSFVTGASIPVDGGYSAH